MKINKRGYWENETSEGHGHDKNLAQELGRFFREQASFYRLPYLYIIDIGCGDGYYTRYLNTLDELICFGYDGNPNTPKIAGNKCGIADFSMKQTLGKKDWVLSLEVGEHIPKEYEDIFIGNLTDHCREGIILSWAIPGQGGDGHVNCRENSYIKKKIHSYGFNYDINSTVRLRNASSSYPNTGYWFRETLMVFRRI